MAAVSYTYKVARQLLRDLGIPPRWTGRPRALNATQREEVRRRYRANPKRWREIARESGISLATFWRVLKETN